MSGKRQTSSSDVCYQGSKIKRRKPTKKREEYDITTATTMRTGKTLKRLKPLHILSSKRREEIHEDACSKQMRLEIIEDSQLDESPILFGASFLRLNDDVEDTFKNMKEIEKKKGNIYFVKKQYLEADQHYLRALRFAPNCPILHSNRAAALFMLNQLSDAVRECEIAIQLDPTFIRAHLRYARCLLVLGETDGAINRLNQIPQTQQVIELRQEIEQFIENFENGKSNIAKLQGRDAQANARTCLEIVPNSTTARILELTSLLINDNLPPQSDNLLEEVSKNLEQIFGFNPTDRGLELIVNLGFILMEIFLFNEAQVYFSFICSLRPNNLEYDFCLKIITALLTCLNLRELSLYEKQYQLLTDLYSFSNMDMRFAPTILSMRAECSFLAGNLLESESDCYICLKNQVTFRNQKLLIQIFIAHSKFEQAEKELDRLFVNSSLTLEQKKQLDLLVREVKIKSKIAHLDFSRSYETIADHYSVLEVSRNATALDIKKSFRRLAVQFHPDKTGGDEKATELFKRIVEANDVLSCPVTRKLYDLSL